MVNKCKPYTRKEFKNYICTLCFGKYHLSCLEQETVIGGYTIHCFTEYQLAAEEEEYKVKTLEQKIADYEKHIKEKNLFIK